MFDMVNIVYLVTTTILFGRLPLLYCVEFYSPFKNSLGACFTLYSKPKHSDFEAFRARFVIAIVSMRTASRVALPDGAWHQGEEHSGY
jgi:hypothetical protein